MSYATQLAAELRDGCTHADHLCACKIGQSIVLKRPVADLFPRNHHQEDPMTQPATYRKRPVEVEAIQFTGTGDSCTAVTAFFGSPYAGTHRWKSTTYDGGWIVTPEGEMEFSPGDWIIRDAKGEFYPCKPDIFEATYGLATDSPPPFDPEALREMASRLLTLANEAEAVR